MAGFDSLPEQSKNKTIKHGISFNILVAGRVSVGKTTLINSLFDFKQGGLVDEEDEAMENPSGVSLRKNGFTHQCDAIKLRLTIIETKGLVDHGDISNSHKPIADFIDKGFEDYLEDELTGPESLYKDISDNRVHCCIYVVGADGLKPIDLATMEQLNQRVCLIPVIGKSDTLTEEQRSDIKEKVRRTIASKNILLYDSAEHQLPLAVAASNEVITENNRRQRVRVYPWAKVYIERDSEIPMLRDLVVNNIISLIETTDRVHYEKYRNRATSAGWDKRNEEFLEFKHQNEEEKAELLHDIKKLELERKPFNTGVQIHSPLKRTLYN